MRPTIILASILITSCSWQPDVDIAPSPDVSTTTINARGDVVVSEDQAGGVTALEPLPPPDGPVAPTITSQPLKPLSAADVRAIRDANDDIEGPAAAQRKAFRKWLETSKESVKLAKVKDARNALIAAIAKDRERLPGCLVVLLGKPLDDAEQRAKACGAKQWAIAENGAVVGGK